MDDRFQPEIETRRLLLRRLRPGDAGFIRTHAGDFQVARNLAVVPHPYPDGAAEAFIQRSLAAEAGRVWLIETGPDGSAIPAGVISLQEVEPGIATIGYWVAPWLWGFGFATEAVGGVSAMAANFGFTCLRASVHEGNPASGRVLSKAGYVQTGEGMSWSEGLGEQVHVVHFELRLDREAK